MAGGYKKIHEHPRVNTNGFDKNPQNRRNKPVSIRAQLKRLLEQDGKITIPATQVYNINDDGSVVLILPTQDQLAMKVMSWALGKRGNESLKALQMIIEQVDGKVTQPVKHEGDLSISKTIEVEIVMPTEE